LTFGKFQMRLRRIFFSLLGAVCAASMSSAQEPAHLGVLSIQLDGVITEERSREVVAQISGIPASVHEIVVVVDSDGGALPDVFAIADALASAKVATYAYVKNAVASAVFIVASCDRIVSDRTGVIGGAGVVSRDFLGFSDSLFSAVCEELTARLRRYSDQKQHDSEIFVAMINQRSSLVRAGKKWKSPGQILSLTAAEMLDLQLAESKWASPKAFVDDLQSRPKSPEATTSDRTPAADAPVAPARGRGWS